MHDSGMWRVCRGIRRDLISRTPGRIVVHMVSRIIGAESQPRKRRRGRIEMCITQQMGKDLRGDVGVGVPQLPSHDDQGHSRGKHQAGCGVAQAVRGH